MGRSNPTPDPAPEYRDDPDAVSLHTTPDDYSYDDAPEITNLPPSYADSQVGSTEVPAHRHGQPPSSRMHHGNYTMKLGKPVVGETQVLMDARYDSDAAFLEDGIRSFATDAPWPLVYVMGTHTETRRSGDKKEKKSITDFRIVMNLRNCLMPNIDLNNDASRWKTMNLVAVENGEKTHRGTIWKQRAPGVKQDIEVGAPKPALKEWCHRYCASPRMLRIFRLRRSVTGFDDELLKNRIEGIIRSTNYQGHISVTFPVENRNVDIYTTNFVNKWRNQTWVCWIFYLTFLWIFTWPYLYFATKRYAVVRAEWPFSSSDAYGNKRYTTVSEEQWFERWHVAIRRLVLDRYEGEAPDEMLASVIARPADPPMPGTIRTGHEGVDNAVGMLTQGFQIARSLSSGSLGASSQSGWGYDN